MSNSETINERRKGRSVRDHITYLTFSPIGAASITMENSAMSLTEQIEAGIRDGSLRQAEVLGAVYRGNNVAAFASVIAKARKLWTSGGTSYQIDDLEIDDEPLVSEGDDGCWVSAWVWVPRKRR